MGKTRRDMIWNDIVRGMTDRSIKEDPGWDATTLWIRMISEEVHVLGKVCQQQVERWIVEMRPFTTRDKL